LAQKFLDAVDALNRDLGIPTVLDALKEADIPALAKAACHEAHTGYPVPRYMTQEVCENLIRQALPKKAAPPSEASAKSAAKPAAKRGKKTS
jgi:alcohol dehydrogenase class IV